jgi:hypothetical protein
MKFGITLVIIVAVFTFTNAKDPVYETPQITRYDSVNNI